MLSNYDIKGRKQKRFYKSTNAKYGSFVPIKLHLNIEGLSANKICVFSRLATRHKGFVILLQETHCTNADQLVSLHLLHFTNLPNFTLAGWVSSRKHGLAIRICPQET